MVTNHNNNKIYQQVVVLTGLFASGKSTAAKFFAQLGATVFDADEFARDVVKPHQPSLEKIAQIFGGEYIKANGELDREKLGQLIFSDKDKKAELEKILHPEIHNLAVTKFKEAVNQHPAPPLIIYDCPLFYETGLDKFPFKAVIVVSAKKEKILERAKLRNNLSAEEIQTRLDSQLPLQEKEKKADYLIHNNASEMELFEEVRYIFNQCANTATDKKPL